MQNHRKAGCEILYYVRCKDFPAVWQLQFLSFSKYKILSELWPEELLN